MKKIFPLLLLLIAGGAAFAWWRNQQLLDTQLEGFAKANGRLELERYRVATLRPGRIAMLHVQEGQQVAKDDVLVSLSSEEAEAKLAAAEAARARAQSAVRRAQGAEQRAKSAQSRADGGMAQADAEIAAQRAQLAIAEEELNNARQLFKQKLISAAELTKRKKARDALRAAVNAANAGKSQAQAGETEAQAAINEAAAGVQEAQAAVAQTDAEIRAIQSAIEDLTVKAPIGGRVEYTVAQAGNVVAAGSVLLSLVDPLDVSMDVFLPISAMGQVAIGAEARIVPDGLPAVLPAQVIRIAEQAQFTPKYVETAAEREHLMYRVTVRIPPEIAADYADYLKGGMTAVGYVRLDEHKEWPSELALRLPAKPQ